MTIDHTPRTQLVKGKAVWRDPYGTLHWAVGDQLAPGLPSSPETFCVWTHCGKFDVPANQAWYKTDIDEVNCGDCHDS